MGNDFPYFRVWHPFDPPGEVEVVPAIDAVSDQLVTGFGDFLFLLYGQADPMRAANGGGAGEPVRQFNIVEP